MDSSSFYFILTNIVVTILVSFQIVKYANENTFFFFSLLHPILNLLFISHDLFNIYVLLETITLLITLLILSSEKFEHKLTALKYIFASSLAMSFYLIGVGMYYYVNGTFDILDVNGLSGFLIKAALFSKSGIFLFGMWLPEVHSNVESEVSAMLSSIYTQSALFPLLRISSEDEFFIVGIITFLFGVFFSIISSDLKKVLAYSSMSQIGLMLLNPIFAPLYVFSHGISKAILFLTTRYQKRDLRIKREVNILLFLTMLICLLSLSGFSLTLGGYVKSKMVYGILSYLISFLSSIYAGKILKVKVDFRFEKKFVYLFLASLILIFPYFNLKLFVVILGMLIGFLLNINFDLSFTTETILTLMTFSVSIFSLFGGVIW
ncbi:proton-conducting transporter transmembrane domain-containing protein [Thermosipho globiformans]|uniref:proton-conducting transporter transmembrane domain-containing protein n=1 Tax=Thermosipho globiformans TaxID=380685 RepID=UPI001F49FB08|nr:proton-conducting transporter membrane subunit [Thermosipho globiformans]